MHDSPTLLSLDTPEHNPPARSYDELITDHRARQETVLKDTGRLLEVRGLPEGVDAYNPSGPFIYRGETHQWFRIESRKAQDAVARLARKAEEGIYELVPDVPSIPVEDPFLSIIGDTYLLGGVEIRKDDRDHVIGYRTVLYAGLTMDALERRMEGPDGMKDIRLIAVGGANSVTVQAFTRPYFPIHSRMMGRIAVTCIDSLEELHSERLAPEHTEWLHGQFTETEWGGVNDAYDLGDGLVGALAHVSKFDEEGKRHYAAAAFIFDRHGRTYSPLEVIAERGDFPMGPIKIMPENLDRPEMHDDLADVVFSSRLTPKEGTVGTSRTLILTCGLSDAAVGELEVENPFLRLTAAYFPDRSLA